MSSIHDVLTRHGSDKATWHQYAPVYELLFPNRDAVTAVMEIGVERGYSVLAWREIFPNALIVGLDHNPPIPVPDRIEQHCGSQRNRNAVLAAAGNRQFDLIIDDASHIIHDQLACLFWLWPHLKPGGYWVCEEFDVQDGIGPHGNLASYDLLRGVQIHRTTSPNGEEMLVVVRKEQP